MGMEQDAAKVMNEDVTLCAVVASRGTGGRVAGGAIAAQITGVVGAVGSAAAAMGADAATEKNRTPSASTRAT